MMNDDELSKIYMHIMTKYPTAFDEILRMNTSMCGEPYWYKSGSERDSRMTRVFEDLAGYGLVIVRRTLIWSAHKDEREAWDYQITGNKNYKKLLDFYRKIVDL